MKYDSLYRLRRMRGYPEFNKKALNIRETAFSVGEAAQLLGVCNQTIRDWDRKGILKTYRTPGGYRRIPEEEINRIKSLTINDPGVKESMIKHGDVATRKDPIRKAIKYIRSIHGG